MNNKIERRQFHAYLNTPIIYNPYQYLPLLKLYGYQGEEDINLEGIKLKDSEYNLLITDEVGLGKTIEAGIIIDEYLHENKKDKILIICPNFLRYKWRNELKNKFYYSSEIFGEKKYININNNIMILPSSKLNNFSGNEYSLIIVDEAHNFKNNNTIKYEQIKKIIDNNKNAKLIFMTATPVNNNIEDFNNIINLLKKENKELLFTNTTKLDAYIDIKNRNIEDIKIDLEDDEINIYEKTNILENFSGTIYKHIGASCIDSLFEYIKEKEFLPEEKELLADEYDYDLKNDNKFENFKKELLSIEKPKVDSKLKRLKEILEENLKVDGFNKKFVIFSHYIKTVLYLYDKIKEVYGNQSVAYIYSDKVSDNLPLKHRKNRLLDVKEWLDGDDIKILICSDTCKEGIDLDSANKLINYDSTFNPVNFEQRIGRIDRMSQKEDMTIYNFWVNGTYDERVYEILKLKLKYILNLSCYNIGNPLNITSDFFDNKKCNELSLEEIDNIKEEEMIKIKNEKIEQYDKLNNILGFENIEEEVTININDNIKEKIINIFENKNYHYKILPVLKNIDEYKTFLEECGERKKIKKEDIKDRISINYKNPSLDNFIPYEIVRVWREENKNETRTGRI